MPSLLPYQGEWTQSFFNGSVLGNAAVLGDSMLACGSAQEHHLSSCFLLDSTTGTPHNEYALPWDTFVSVISHTSTSLVASSAGTPVALVSNFLSSRESVASYQLAETSSLYDFIVTGYIVATRSSAIAFCKLPAEILQCFTKTLTNFVLYGSVWNPTVRTLVHVGKYATYPTIAAMDETGAPKWMFVLIVRSLQSVSFTSVCYVPGFVGIFIAGPGVSSAAGATISVVSGWFHSDVGRLYNVLSLTPMGTSIMNTMDLVHEIAVESATLDTVVVGGVILRTGDSVSRISAYILRYNSLFHSVAYGVRYVSVSASDTSVAKSLLIVDSYVFMVCDILNTVHNRIDLGVFKLKLATGEVVKQVRVTGSFSLQCSAITANNNNLLSISCGVQNEGFVKPLVFTISRDLSFGTFFDGYVLVKSEVVQALSFPFTASLVSVAQTTSSTAVTSGSFTSSGKVVIQSTVAPSRSPTRAPSRAPTRSPTVFPPTSQPSSQPSTQPTSQPTTEPTSSPSISPSPTAVPSTGAPTNTFRPTGQPSGQPSTQPSTQPVSSPSARPSSVPSIQPTQRPSAQPSEHPSAQPSRSPSSQPLSVPSGQPSVSPTQDPSGTPTLAPTVAEVPDGPLDDDGHSSSESGKKAVRNYVIPVTCSIFGAVLVAFCITYRKAIAAKFGLSDKRKFADAPPPASIEVQRHRQLRDATSSVLNGHLEDDPQRVQQQADGCGVRVGGVKSVSAPAPAPAPVATSKSVAAKVATTKYPSATGDAMLEARERGYGLGAIEGCATADFVVPRFFSPGAPSVNPTASAIKILKRTENYDSSDEDSLLRDCSTSSSESSSWSDGDSVYTVSEESVVYSVSEESVVYSVSEESAVYSVSEASSN
jgi:hypothetical protein